MNITLTTTSGHTNQICKSHYIMRKKKLEKMQKEATKKWLNPRKYYINSFINHQSLKYCPECGAEVEYSSEDEDEAYCTKCGLVTSSSYPYVAGIKIDYPYGIRL